VSKCPDHLVDRRIILNLPGRKEAFMEPYAVAGLSLITLMIVLIVALRSKQKTEERKKDPDAPKSALAKDGDPHRPVD
jgi:hypothetical protein